MNQLTHHNSKGITTLALVVSITVALVAIILSLQIITLLNVQLAKNHLSQQSTYYAAEATLYDTMLHIVKSGLSWPPGNDYTDQLDSLNGTQVSRHITFQDNKYTIDVTAFSNQSARRLVAKIDKVITSAFGIDVVLVIDTSGSMDDESGQNCDGPSQPVCQPLDDTRRAATAIVDEAITNGIDVQFAVYAIGNISDGKQPLTNNLNSVKSAINNLSIGDSGGVYTNVGDGFLKAEQELQANGRPNTLQYIILLSDGVANRRGTSSSIKSCDQFPTEHNDCTGDFFPDSAISRAQDAQKVATQVYTIGLNIANLPTNNTGSCLIEPCGTQAVARSTLIESASTPDLYYEAPSSAELAGIFSTIFGEINSGPALLIRELPPE